jgi:hypothetical protein
MAICLENVADLEKTPAKKPRLKRKTKTTFL